VFFDDFEEETWKYSAGDLNSNAGYDYWGTKPYNYSFEWTPTFPCGTCFWCATVGYNSVKNKPNLEVLYYDKNMNAYLQRDIDLKPYKQVWFLYCIGAYGMESGDYLELYARDADFTWNLVDYITSPLSSRQWRKIGLSNDVNCIKFVFISDNDNDVKIGVFLYYIEIRATLPNDAETNGDASDNLEFATITDKLQFSGYLDDEDCYMLTTSWGGQNARICLCYPQNAIFQIEAYNKYGEKLAGPSTTIIAPLTGELYLKIYSKIGFGPYQIIITYADGGGGGGGGGPPKLLGGELS